MNESLPCMPPAWSPLAAALPRLKRRLELSRAKHPSLAGHSRMAKRVARLVPHYEYDEDDLLRADGAPDDIAQRRRDGFHGPFAPSSGSGSRARPPSPRRPPGSISDLQFTGPLPGALPVQPPRPPAPEGRRLRAVERAA